MKKPLRALLGDHGLRGGRRGPGRAHVRWSGRRARSASGRGGGPLAEAAHGHATVTSVSDVSSSPAWAGVGLAKGSVMVAPDPHRGRPVGDPRGLERLPRRLHAARRQADRQGGGGAGQEDPAPPERRPCARGGHHPAAASPRSARTARLDLAAFEANLEAYAAAGPRAATSCWARTARRRASTRTRSSTLVRAARARARPAAPCSSGTGLESTRATIALTRKVADLGRGRRARPHAALLQVADDRRTRCARHFEAVADASPIPVLPVLGARLHRPPLARRPRRRRWRRIRASRG